MRYSASESLKPVAYLSARICSRSRYLSLALLNAHTFFRTGREAAEYFEDYAALDISAGAADVALLLLVFISRPIIFRSCTRHLPALGGKGLDINN